MGWCTFCCFFDRFIKVLTDNIQVSLGTEETYLLSLSIRSLTKQFALRSVRLFGKVLGTQKDYIIVESELENPDEEYDDPFSSEKEEGQKSQENAQEEAKEPELDEDGNPKIPEELQGIPPKPKAKRQAKYASEQQTGVNRYVYWACNQGTIFYFIRNIGKRRELR